MDSARQENEGVVRLRLLAAMLWFPFSPRRAVTVVVRYPLWQVYLGHLAMLILVALVLVVFDFTQYSLSPYGSHSITDQVLTEPRARGIVLIVFLGGEVIHILIATLMMGWAGQDEPLIDSWIHAVRVSWAYTSHLIWIVGAWGMWIVLNSIGFNDEDYIVAYMATIWSVTIWSIIVYLRGLTVSRETKAGATTRDPQCEWCGYNLLNIALGATCPECGEPVKHSLEPERRQALSNRHGAIDSHDVRLMIRAWRQPKSVFRAIPAHSRSRLAFRLLAWSIGLTIPFSGGAALLSVGMTVGNWPPPQFMIAIPLVVGSFVAWVLFMFASLVATFIGWSTSRRVGRNCLNAAALTLCLTSGILPIWGGVGMMILGMGLGTLSYGGGVIAFMTLWFVGHGLAGVFYVRAIDRRIRYLQYANR